MRLHYLYIKGKKGEKFFSKFRKKRGEETKKENNKKLSPNIGKSFLGASQERFELPTDGLEGRCSILLSYWDII